VAQPFEIIGNISDVETFATGGGSVLVCVAFMVAHVGASGKESRKSDYPMAQSISLSYIGTRLAESPTRIQDQAPSITVRSMARNAAKQLVVCIKNDGYLASLEKRKIYVALRDAQAGEHGLLRIIDESGDDYLIRNSCFDRSRFHRPARRPC
jgi:hypothetical protein